MKKSALIFATCVVLSGLCGLSRGDDADTARAATRRTTGSVGTSNVSSRQKTNTNTSTQANVSSRTTGAVPKAASTSAGRNATPRIGPVVSDGSRRTDAVTQTVGTRAAANVAPRTGTVQPRIQSTSARTATTPLQNRTVTHARGAISSARTATSGTARSATRPSGIARSATVSADLREQIINRDYKSCRTIFFECMDEFCANKDSQLKRCACSSRLHEFDRVKKRLSAAEDKMLDFSERLLTVNMDKEDVAALYTATEGELAFYNTKDTSDSKGILDEIAKKLKTGTSDDSFNQSLSAISLSLDMDSAFDSVDSLMGVNTTTKEGEELYSAALPVCREMASEVCDEESLNLAISGYQMAIEQDCTTVSKSYSSQVDQARDKIRESGALLDMSRLNIYQQRNSDDILTCKKKMLTQLSDTSVCGENLSKCLDMTGQYIDPTTGQAFLTDNLSNLANLIIRPSGNQSWTTAPGNTAFVQYLYSKKKYLEPAMENCQDIADNVWDEFLEDALAQIKLAQESKLEEVRQSCTTLTTQCLADTAKSLEDFDARALSTFGVEADKTVNAMCASVKDACTALLQNTTGDESWVGGMSQIATEKTYDTIIQTCREVGRACIIQACKSISGNFGLCESLTESVNRKSIINRTACWDEVLNCVASAGTDSISKIFDGENNSSIFGFNKETGDFYNTLYGSIEYKKLTTETAPCQSEQSCIYDYCAGKCDVVNSFECRVCRIAESIWGNCEAHPNSSVAAQGAHNQILIPNSQGSTDKKSLISTTDTQSRTLLAWLAINTGTMHSDSSCISSECPAGYKLIDGVCVDTSTLQPESCKPDGASCTEEQRIMITENLTNCCPTKQNNRTCCKSGTASKTLSSVFYGVSDLNVLGNLCKISKEASDTFQPILYDDDAGRTLVCFGTIEASKTSAEFPSGQQLNCSGRWVYINDMVYKDAVSNYYYSFYWNADGSPVTVQNNTSVNAALIGIGQVSANMCENEQNN